MQHILALSSSSRGGVRFALSSTQKVTISPFPFTVTFAHILCDQHFVILLVCSVSVYFTPGWQKLAGFRRAQNRAFVERVFANFRNKNVVFLQLRKYW